MTCIVGLEHDGRVTIGADSAAVEGTRITARSDPKVFVVGPYLIGFTDSFRMGQVLRFCLDVPEQASTVDDFEHLVTVFVDAVRSCLKDAGVAREDHGEESGGTFLVGYRGTLYCVDSDYQVAVALCGFEAIGCGEEFALGSLSSRTGNPRRRVLKALEVAAIHSTGVCEPFVTLTA
jgi:ATP-dependent protease HslVU (ClpYQ) peptidase subunit